MGVLLHSLLMSDTENKSNHTAYFPFILISRSKGQKSRSPGLFLYSSQFVCSFNFENNFLDSFYMVKGLKVIIMSQHAMMLCMQITMFSKPVYLSVSITLWYCI